MRSTLSPLLLSLVLLPGWAQAADFEALGPYAHENLTVFLLRGKATKAANKKYLTLAQALKEKKVKVHETGDVNTLAIENLSSEEVYVQAGDIVKGGRQDRTLGTDLILPRKSGKVPIAAFCVESGRWTSARANPRSTSRARARRWRARASRSRPARPRIKARCGRRSPLPRISWPRTSRRP